MIPILFLFEDDGVVQVMDVESEQTMDEVAAAGAKFTVGLRVPAQPGRVLRVRLHGTNCCRAALRSGILAGK